MLVVLLQLVTLVVVTMGCGGWVRGHAHLREHEHELRKVRGLQLHQTGLQEMAGARQAGARAHLVCMPVPLLLLLHVLLLLLLCVLLLLVWVLLQLHAQPLLL